MKGFSFEITSFMHVVYISIYINNDNNIVPKLELS